MQTPEDLANPAVAQTPPPPIHPPPRKRTSENEREEDKRAVKQNECSRICANALFSHLPRPTLRYFGVHILNRQTINFTSKLQEIFRGLLSSRNPSLAFGCSLKNLEILIEMLVQFQDGGYVPTPVAVVRGRPYSDQSVAEHGFVPLHHQLVRPGNKVQLVRGVELQTTSRHIAVANGDRTLRCTFQTWQLRWLGFAYSTRPPLQSHLADDVRAEQVTSTAWTQTPPIDVLRIRPQQVAHSSVMRDLQQTRSTVSTAEYLQPVCTVSRSCAQCPHV